MAYAYVAGTVEGGGSTNVTSSAINTTGATVIFVTIHDALSVFGLSDSKGNTPSYYVAHSSQERTYVYENPTVGSGHTFTNSGSSGSYPAISVGAFQSSADSVFDQQNYNTTNPAYSTTTGSITPTRDDSLVLAGAYWSSVRDVTINSGFTLIGSRAALTSSAIALGYLIQTTAAPVNPTWTQTDTTYFVSMTGYISSFYEDIAVSGPLPKIIQTKQAPTRASFF